MKIMIDTDWFAAMKDLPSSKQKEIMTAIMDYPNKESDTHLWKNVIKPSLERGKISYYNKLNSLKQYNPQKTNKKISDTGIRTESNIIKSNIIEKSNKGGMGGKEREERKFIPPTEQEVLDYAEEMDSIAGVGGFTCSQDTAQEFFLHYQAQGWRIGNDSNTPIRDWKAKLKFWAVKDKIKPMPIRPGMPQIGKININMTKKDWDDMENKRILDEMMKGL